MSRDGGAGQRWIPWLAFALSEFRDGPATIIPVVKAFQARHQLADMVVVADAGMLSATNLRELDEAQLRFIVGWRVTKALADLASHFRWYGDAFSDGQLIDTITVRTGHQREQSDVAVGAGVGQDHSWRVVAGRLGVLDQAGGPRQPKADISGEPGPGLLIWRWFCGRRQAADLHEYRCCG